VVSPPPDPIPGPAGNAYDKYASPRRLEQLLLRRFLATLDAALPARPPRRVLEVGMGEGVVAERVRARYPGAAVAGIDLAGERLGAPWRARGLAGVAADAGRLPFPPDTFDLVLAIEVLEHLRGPEAALGEVARVGRHAVILSVPCEPLWRLGNLVMGRYRSHAGNTPGHVQHWSAGAFRRLVARHLTVDAVRRPLPWTLLGARVPAPG